MKQLLLVMMLFLPFSGCQKKQPEQSNNTVTVTADDLAHAHGVNWWIIDIGTVPKGKTLCIAFVDREGRIESRGCPGVKAGDKVKIVLSDFSAWNLRYSIVVGDRAHRSTIMNHFKFLDGPETLEHSGSHQSPGKFLMKKSSTGMVHGTTSPLEDREIAITVDFYERDQPWVREGYERPKGKWLREVMQD